MASNMVAVEVDHEEWAKLPAKVVRALRLTVGRQIDLDAVQQHRIEIELQIALQASARLLNVRGRSKAEITKRLVQKGLSADAIEIAAGKLERAGMIDDARFAQDWIEQRNHSRPASSRTRRAELQSLGVAKEFIADALVSESSGDELALARSALSRWRRVSTLPEAGSDEYNLLTRKAISFLQRRGFVWEIVRQAVSERFPGQISSDGGEYLPEAQ